MVKDGEALIVERQQLVCPALGQTTTVLAYRDCAQCFTPNAPACRDCSIRSVCQGYTWWQCPACGGWHLTCASVTANDTTGS